MKLKLLCLMLVIFALVLAGCEGPEGPQGPEGAQGDPAAQYGYLGDNANSCGHCHGSTAGTWMETGHHEAYDALYNPDDPYCLQCHTVGFDAEVYEDEDTSYVVAAGPELTGFDDYWPPETADDSVRFEALKNVQCESCHGPMGPTINDHAPILNFTTRIIDGEETSMCVKCHEQVEEWHESGHGKVLERTGETIEDFSDDFDGCAASCHTGQGFMVANDPDWTGATFETYELIGCQGCHDPHDGTNEHQLRNLDTYTVLCDTFESRTFEDYGTAQLCVQCHHGRRDSENVLGQIEDGYDHFGPHSSPQMDLFLGTGSYEIAGYTYNRDHDHNTLTEVINDTVAYEACVTCHMEMRGHSDPLGWKGGHDFTPTEATCANNCHVAPGLDYHGVRVDIDAKLAELASMLVIDPEYYGDPDSLTADQRMAAYAYAFVSNDGSHGVHNPNYALSLLDNAIAWLGTLESKKQGITAQR